MKIKAAVLLEMGRPRPYRDSQPLVVEELELEGPADDEVLVEIVAAGLCHSDLSVINGSRPRPTPLALGHEAAGIVRETGARVKGLRPDDHVVFSFVPMCGRCERCLVGRPATCLEGARANGAGTLLNGARRLRRPGGGGTVHHHLGVSGFAEYAVAVPGSLVKVDPELPLERAALFGCAVITGVGAVVNTVQVPLGAAVGVFGLGGVGLAAILGAVAVGAEPIVAVDVLADKLALARRLGATHAVNARETDAVAAVRALTGGGVDYAFEVAGRAEVLLAAYQATRPGGTTVAVGLPDPKAVLTIPALSLAAEERTLKGSYMGSAVPPRDVPRLVALHRAGRLPVEALHTGTVGLEGINEAFDRLADGQEVRQILRPRPAGA